MTNIEELKRLLNQAFELQEHLYNTHILAVQIGDRFSSDRLRIAADKAMKRYKRRYDAYCRAAGKPKQHITVPN